MTALTNEMIVAAAHDRVGEFIGKHMFVFSEINAYKIDIGIVLGAKYGSDEMSMVFHITGTKSVYIGFFVSEKPIWTNDNKNVAKELWRREAYFDVHGNDLKAAVDEIISTAHQMIHDFVL